MIQQVVYTYQIEIYKTIQGKVPYHEWLRSESKSGIASVIHTRLVYVQLGNLGVFKNLKDGLYELKIFHGPGYRIYFAFIAVGKILIICAGTKRTQQKDIEMAKKYLKDYKSRGNR